ncbi:MAG: hypothetical protein FGM40_09415 [Rhodocyclaceae bacterium]|nr:hypothetical protein [Rhodocyclaceae bacterium]
MSARLQSSGTVPCRVELAHTADDCYAHVILQDVEVGPGDSVQVLDPPTHIAWGERYAVERKAKVSRASWWERFKTHALSRFELDLLWEVSFSERRFSTSRNYPRPRPTVRTQAISPTGGPQP